MSYIIRITASVVLILGGGYLGMLAASVFSVRERQLNRLVSVLTRLNFNIAFLHMNIADAMFNASETNRSVVHKLFCTASEYIRRDGIPPASAFERVLRSLKDELCLTRDDTGIILEFAENLGSGDPESETRNIKAACAKLTVAANEAKGESEQRGKLWRGLGFLGGILTAIILF